VAEKIPAYTQVMLVANKIYR